MSAASWQGVYGHPDAVAWRAMADLMIVGSLFARLSAGLCELRTSGNVVGSIAACDAVMAAEQELGYKTLRCQKLAGERATAAALNAVGVGQEDGGAE